MLILKTKKKIINEVQFHKHRTDIKDSAMEYEIIYKY